MTRQEYLNEIREGLAGQLPEAEIADILSEYESFFEAGKEEGRDEYAVAESLGSPALLVRQVMEGKTDDTGITRLAPANFSRRLASFAVDAFCATLPAILLTVWLGFSSAATMVPMSLFFFYPAPAAGLLSAISVAVFEEVTEIAAVETPDGPWVPDNSTSKQSAAKQVAVGLSLVFYLLYAPVTAYIFDGRTLGKRLLRLRVIQNGRKSADIRIVTREFLFKTLINSIPLVALFSILSAVFDRDHRAIHDRILDTLVVETK